MNEWNSYLEHSFPHSSCTWLLTVCRLDLWLLHFAQLILCLEEYPFIVHPILFMHLPSGLSSNVSSSGQSYLTSLNRVKNSILAEWLFHSVYLCNNLLQNLVVKITVYYIPGFRGICTRHSGVACPCLSWKAWWWGWDHLMTCSLTWLVVDGKGQTSVGWNSGVSLASFSISLLFPHIATSRWLDFLQGGSGLQRCTEREREPGRSCILYMI